MKLELRSIDRHFADFICRESGCQAPELWFATALLSYATGQGHICLDLAAVAGAEVVLTDGKTGSLPDTAALIGLLRGLPTVAAPGGFCPLVLDDAGRLYLYRYWSYEQNLAQVVLGMVRDLVPVCEQTLREGMVRLFPGQTRTETDWQAVAALAAVRKRLTVISGGPGTGKTSTVVKILALLLEQYPDRQLRIALAAPTGKAAARLKESIAGMKAQLPCSEQVRQKIPTAVTTIHRLLGFVSGSTRFRYSSDNPLPFDLVVIDESSMVDLPLMAKLATALKPDARLILLGDRDQLASVEAGAVLGDLCGTGRAEPFSPEFRALAERVTGSVIPENAVGVSSVPLVDTLVVLKKNYRFEASSRIGILARAINGGDCELALAVLDDQADEGITWHDLPAVNALKPSLASEIVAGYRYYLAAGTVEDALLRFDSFRVLCALREGAFGVAGLTTMIEELLAEHGLIDPRNRWYRGRPILVTANDYGMKLFNGDVGMVFPDADGQPRVFFPVSDGGLKSVSPVRLPEHQTVYAMTIHKSQGSEFERVLMVLPDHDAAPLTRELIYTGITRARQQVDIRGNRNAFTAAVTRTTGRRSGLADALWS